MCLYLIVELMFFSFFSIMFSDEKDCFDCEEVLKELEHIDDDADDLDIMLVKIKDMRFARKYGISQAPALVYFRKRFPAIYRGNLIILISYYIML